ncbi:hypothetical protein A0128_06145 [Leptospira tipperaryensis]|uniref:Uncharacterized protein n=1 Tax=Leptospira tipperaryensis TaxID=2564040 RepID=A0A1D7UVA5_9LEPT|nr:hypothetical protein A0128_06145 [Leptospira tipperaryensis]
MPNRRQNTLIFRMGRKFLSFFALDAGFRKRFGLKTRAEAGSQKVFFCAEVFCGSSYIGKVVFVCVRRKDWSSYIFNKARPATSTFYKTILNLSTSDNLQEFLLLKDNCPFTM